jgi:hypothetical protein
MNYRVVYHPENWVRAESGAPELWQVRTADLGDGTELVAVLVCGMDGGLPRVAEAWIEQAYITRTAGWKRRTVKRLRVHEVELVAEADAEA